MLNLTIPSNFNLEKESILDCFKFIDKISTSGKIDICLDFILVKKNLSNGVKMLLFAQIEKYYLEKRGRIYVKNRPDSLKVSSGFHVRANELQISRSLYKHNKLYPDVIESMAGLLKKIGINKKNERYRVTSERIGAFMTEIMANAIEHGIKNKDINCWFTADVIGKESKIVYTFVDMGKGIAKSHRKANLNFRYRIWSDARIVLKSLKGEIPSSTGEDNRGKGLPEIRKIVEDGLVVDFRLITNNVAIDYENKKFNVQKIPNFAGTYYSWTVVKNKNYE